MKTMQRIFLLACLLVVSATTFGQSAIIRGEVSAGSYQNIKTDANGSLFISGPTGTAATDPCASSGIAKSSVTVAVTTATTTQLVALSGSTVVYVCDFSVTISQVVTTANTLRFVYGTGASCGTGTVNLTGDFGAGGVTAAAPIVIVSGNVPGTLFKTIAGQALCVTTAIGATASFQGFITYVQQ